MTTRYRTIGQRASVDESLFGERSSGISKTRTTPLRVASAPSERQAVVISQNELFRIKNEAIFKSEAELAAEREAAKALKDDRERQAKARKERMRQLEIAARAKSMLSDEEVAKNAKEQALRDAAKIMIDERSDVVKTLSSMAARAAAFNLREQQIAEKARREEREKEYEKQMDLIMEIDRIKDLQRREEEENLKKVKRFEDRKVITEQMEVRRRQKAIEAELREQDNVAMRQRMEKFAEEDRLANERKQVEIERSRAEVLRANAAAIEKKKEAKVLERKEIEDILVYQALKDAELAKREEEERALEKAKKERQALLLSQQEKAKSNADKMDEIRARRAAEDHERKARQKEKEDRLRRKAEMDELLQSRAAQAADKQRRLQLEKDKRLDEVQSALQVMQTMANREAEEQARKRELSNAHRINLSKQITEVERQRAQMKANRMSEGDQLRQGVVSDIAKYSVIRDQMVSDLEAKGVNPRFLSEMKNVDVAKIVRR